MYRNLDTSADSRKPGDGALLSWLMAWLRGTLRRWLSTRRSMTARTTSSFWIPRRSRSAFGASACSRTLWSRPSTTSCSSSMRMTSRSPRCWRFYRQRNWTTGRLEADWSLPCTAHSSQEGLNFKPWATRRRELRPYSWCFQLSTGKWGSRNRWATWSSY